MLIHNMNYSEAALRVIFLYHHHIDSYIMHQLSTTITLQTVVKGTGDQILLPDVSQT